MSDMELKNKRQRHQDRVTLDQGSLNRVDAWIEQIRFTAKGIVVARKDVVNWLVRQHDELLAPTELDELKSRYFSDVRFLQQAIKELRAAKRRGDAVDLAEILGGATANLKTAPVRRRRKKRELAGEFPSPELDTDSVGAVE